MVCNGDDGVTYGGVEEAFVVHGQVELGLDTLDGHHAEPHRDQVEHSCTNTHTHADTHPANTEGKQREREILININVPSGMMTPPFCH